MRMLFKASENPSKDEVSSRLLFSAGAISINTFFTGMISVETPFLALAVFLSTLAIWMPASVATVEAVLRYQGRQQNQ